MRDLLAFGGGYLSVSKSENLPIVSTGLVLRGDRSDRRYNRLVAIGHQDGKLSLYLIDYAQVSPIASSVQVQAHGLAVTALAYDADTRRLVSGSDDGLLRVWQVGIDGTGAPTLTPVQTVPAPQPYVSGLAFGTSSGQKYLVASLLSPQVYAGWRWTNGTLSQSPNWVVQSPIPEAYRVYPLTPYGELEFVGAYAEMGGCRTHNMGWLVHAGDGSLEYVLNDTIMIVSPLMNGQRYIAQAKWILLQYYWGAGGGGGLLPYRLEKSQRLTSTPYLQPATAIGSLVSGGTRYVCVGYADGLLRLFTRSGSGSWSQATNSSAFHGGARVVGVRLMEVGGTIYSLSVDVSGHIEVVRQTGGGVPVSVGSFSPSDSYTVTSADWGRDSAGQVVVALGGHEGSVNQVRVYQITWSGGSASIGPVGDVSLGSDAGYVSGVRFVQNGSLDILVSSGSETKRWNWSSSGSYTQAYSFGSNTGNAKIAMVSGSAWLLQPGYYENTGAVSVWNLGSGSATQVVSVGGVTRNGVMHEVGTDEAIIGLEFFESQGNTYRVDGLTRRRLIELPTDSGLTPAFDATIFASLPDGALDISVDTADDAYIYAACRDGSVVQVALPRWESKDLGYAGFSAVQFEAIDVIGINFTRFVPTSGLWYARGGGCDAGGYGTRHAGLIQLTTGNVLLDATLNGWAMSSGRSTASQLTPDGMYMYSYELDSWRLTVWDSNSNSLFGTTNYQQHWWLQAVDSTTIGLLRYEVMGSITVNNQTYAVVRPWIRFIDWTTNTHQEYVLDDSRYVVVTGYEYSNLSSFRWELNPNRNLAVVYGLDNDTYSNNSTGQNYRKIWVLKRTNLGNWSSWSVTSILNPQSLGGVEPSMIKFHSYYPDKLFVGLQNGRLRAYTVDVQNGTIDLNNYIEWTPTMGNVGPVRVMDVREFTKDGVIFTVLVFGGSEGLSIWTWDRCRADRDPNTVPTYEAGFYDTDIGFTDLGYISVSQTDAESDPYLVYSNGWVLSCAKLEALPVSRCPWDIDANGITDDADLLAVLFEFGASNTYTLADVNCDGIVDDADLLLVLFHFGEEC